MLLIFFLLWLQRRKNEWSRNALKLIFTSHLIISCSMAQPVRASFFSFLPFAHTHTHTPPRKDETWRCSLCCRSHATVVFPKEEEHRTTITPHPESYPCWVYCTASRKSFRVLIARAITEPERGCGRNSLRRKSRSELKDGHGRQVFYFMYSLVGKELVASGWGWGRKCKFWPR